MKQLKYTGEFKDLVPLGFRFQKMYARNYRCYHTYDVKKSEARISFWIYQKGRNIEIEDWNGLEVSIIEYIQANPFTPYYKQCGKMNLHIDYVSLLCNKETFEVRKATHKDDAIQFFIAEEEGRITEEECASLCKAFYKTYRVINVVPEELLRNLKVLEGRYKIIEEAL